MYFNLVASRIMLPSFRHYMIFNNRTHSRTVVLFLRKKCAVVAGCTMSIIDVSYDTWHSLRPLQASFKVQLANTLCVYFVGLYVSCALAAYGPLSVSNTRNIHHLSLKLSAWKYLTELRICKWAVCPASVADAILCKITFLRSLIVPCNSYSEISGTQMRFLVAETRRCSAWLLRGRLTLLCLVVVMCKSPFNAQLSCMKGVVQILNFRSAELCMICYSHYRALRQW